LLHQIQHLKRRKRRKKRKTKMVIKMKKRRKRKKRKKMKKTKMKKKIKMMKLLKLPNLLHIAKRAENVHQRMVQRLSKKKESLNLNQIAKWSVVRTINALALTLLKENVVSLLIVLKEMEREIATAISEMNQIKWLKRRSLIGMVKKKKRKYMHLLQIGSHPKIQQVI